MLHNHQMIANKLNARAFEMWQQTEHDADFCSVDAAIDTTTIRIYDVIGHDFISSESIAATLQSAKTKKIDIRVNSPGGDVFEGIAIYNAIRERSKSKAISITIDALAASIASVIAIAVPPVIKPGAFMMIHNPWTVAIGNAADLRHVADTLDSVAKSMHDIYKEHTGLTSEMITEIMDKETWLSAEEAAVNGFAMMEQSDIDNSNIAAQMAVLTDFLNKIRSK